MSRLSLSSLRPSGPVVATFVIAVPWDTLSFHIRKARKLPIDDGWPSSCHVQMCIAAGVAWISDPIIEWLTEENGNSGQLNQYHIHVLTERIIEEIYSSDTPDGDTEIMRIKFSSKDLAMRFKLVWDQNPYSVKIENMR